MLTGAPHRAPIVYKGPVDPPHTWKQHMPEFHLRKRRTNISVWLSHTLRKIKDTLVRDKKDTLPLGGHSLSLSLCVWCVCVCVCVSVWQGRACVCLCVCVCVCTVWGGCTASDQKQSALVQSVSVPTFTHKRQGTQVCHSAQTYTYTHIHTHTHTYTHLSHTKHTNPPSSRHPARPLTIGQVPEPSASPSRLKGPFGKAGDRGKRSWCYLSRWLSGSPVQGKWLDLPPPKDTAIQGLHRGHLG